MAGQVFTTRVGGVVIGRSGSVAVGPSVAVTVPGPISNLSIRQVTTGSIALTWTAPTTGTQPFTGYSVIYSTSSGGPWTTFGTVTTPSVTVTGLAASTTYYFSVAAINGAGTGPYVVSQPGQTADGSNATLPQSRKGIAGGLDGYSGSALTTAVNNAKAMGASWIRMVFDWNVMQPNGRGTALTNTASMDAAVQALADAGIRVIGIVAFCANWANGGANNQMVPPIDSADYASYAALLAQHYGPMGVHVWEIWNEPNITTFWFPAANPAKYTDMLKKSYTAIKAADPQSVVITAGLAPAADDGANMQPATFLNAIYTNGGKNYCDGIGNHPYTKPAFADGDWNAGAYWWAHMLGPFRNNMINNGDAAKQVWITEYGGNTQGSSAVSEADQAKMVTIAYSMAEDYDWIRVLCWYNFQDGTDIEDTYGLIRNDGTPKPGHDALALVPPVHQLGPDLSVFPENPLPNQWDAKDTTVTTSLELGMQFKSSSPITVVGARYYKASNNTGPHLGRLWDDNGNKLAEVSFTNETLIGWQSATFPSPVPILPNTNYRISYNTTNGHYALDSNYFTSAPKVSGVLTGIAGVFDYAGGFPSANYQQSNYYADIIGSGGGSAVLPQSRKGIAGGLSGYSGSALTTAVNDAKAMGASWIRMVFDWNVMQPNGRGTALTNTASMDAAVQALAAAGISVIGLAAFCANWANGGANNQMVPPIDNADYASYVALLAQRYGPMGVHVWEIWNEPNITTFWFPSADPVKYTDMLKKSYTAIKAADPQSVVITAGLAPAADDGANMQPATFLNAIYTNGGKNYCDGVGNHPYTKPAFADGDYNAGAYWWGHMIGPFRNAMISNGDAAKQIWITEYGGNTQGSSAVSEADQAKMVTIAYYLGESYDWLRVLCWYNFQDGTDIEDTYGLIRNDGTPKPAHDAFALVPPVHPLGPALCVFPDNPLPGGLDNGDSSVTTSIELGMKFKSSSAMSVAGVRFYKTSTNTGPHKGRLWDDSGNKLAEVTFSNETLVGWQSAMFSSPVPISANTNYRISYNATTGHYSGDNDYFTAGPKVSGVLQGIVGLYDYTDGFPTSIYHNSNYYVDIIGQ